MDTALVIQQDLCRFHVHSENIQTTAAFRKQAKNSCTIYILLYTSVLLCLQIDILHKKNKSVKTDKMLILCKHNGGLS